MRLVSGDYNVIAGIDVFNLTCLGWQDEGFTNDTFTETEPLFYLFFLSYGEDDSFEQQDDDYRRQLLYFDRKSVSTYIKSCPIFCILIEFMKTKIEYRLV